MTDVDRISYGNPSKLIRLEDEREWDSPWRKWGPYLSERQWGTVREDYSHAATRGSTFPTITRARAPIAGARTGSRASATTEQRLCFALALWNGKDPILKERLFGLTNAEGNHGEDVKEYYFYLDSTPTHSYMKYLYKYPQARFPYDDLVADQRQRGAARTPSTSYRHRRVRRETATSTCSSSTQGLARGHLHPHHRHTTGARRPRRCTSCRPCGSATPGSWWPMAAEVGTEGGARGAQGERRDSLSPRAGGATGPGP